MTPDHAFQIANLVAIGGWLALLLSPFAPVGTDRIAGLLVPGALAVGYVATIAWFWGASEPAGTPSFTTLDGVAALLGTREALAAGWIHYLAFDLFVGAWETRDARRRGIPFWAGRALPVLHLRLRPVRPLALPRAAGGAGEIGSSFSVKRNTLSRSGSHYRGRATLARG